MFRLKKLSQFKKGMKSIVLPPAKKSELKESIVDYMKAHSVRKIEMPRLKPQTQKNILFFNPQHMYAKIATLLILLSGSGTVFAAENTVPGDTLYPVKVHINEPVRGAIAVGAEAKANWATEVAERRLDEASHLAAKGTLSTSSAANIETRFTLQTEKIKEQIAKLQASGKTEIASGLNTRLESSIQIHSQILDKINSEDGATKHDLKPLIQKLKGDVESIRDLKKQFEDGVKEKHGPDVKVAAQNHMEVAIKQIEKVKELLRSKNVSATSSAQLKLNEAQKAFEAGKSKFDAGNYMASFISFGTAQKFAAEARVMIRVASDIKIDERISKILEQLGKKDIELSDEQKENLEIKVKNNLETRIDKALEKENKIEEKTKMKIEKFEDKEKDSDSSLNLELNTSSTVTLDLDED